MKYIAEFEISRIEQDAPVGEDLDAAVKNGIMYADIEGWEIIDTTLKIMRKGEKSKDINEIESIRRIAKLLQKVLYLMSINTEPFPGLPNVFKTPLDWAQHLVKMILNEDLGE